MKRSLVLLAACVLAPAGAAVAETLVVNDQVQVAPSDVQAPHRGATMKAVEQQFGAPAERHAAVGGASSAQPPITRWDYARFSVFFEKDRVVHTVVRGG
jgi:hypothetical protein